MIQSPSIDELNSPSVDRLNLEMPVYDTNREQLSTLPPSVHDEIVETSQMIIDEPNNIINSE